MSDIPTPKSLFCPKCGEMMQMERIADAQTLAKLEESGYVAGARGMCECGVTAVLAMKRMPENPTFSLLFNIYKFETPKDKVVK